MAKKSVEKLIKREKLGHIPACKKCGWNYFTIDRKTGELSCRWCNEWSVEG